MLQNNCEDIHPNKDNIHPNNNEIHSNIIPYLFVVSSLIFSLGDFAGVGSISGTVVVWDSSRQT